LLLVGWLVSFNIIHTSKRLLDLFNRTLERSGREQLLLARMALKEPDPVPHRLLHNVRHEDILAQLGRALILCRVRLQPLAKGLVGGAMQQG
jgi:hypothetical protein